MTDARVQSERNIGLYGWINFLAGITFLTPVVTVLYQHTGLSIAEIVIISNIATLSVWIFELPTSVMADVFGRRQSLVVSVSCNFLSALAILFFPSFLGFAVASFFSGLYFTFWSGAGQAFLEENLRSLGKVGKEREFGKVIGLLMSYEHIGALVVPVMISLILKYFGDHGYVLLAFGDVISAGILLFLTFQLRESFSQKQFESLSHIITEHISVAKSALKRVFTEANLRTLVIYRSLANHVAFFPLIFFPVVINKGMPEYWSGIIVAVTTIGAMLASRFVYKLGERHSYNAVWIFSTMLQAIILIVAGLVFQFSWTALIIAYILFESIESLWQPAWNHVLVEQSKGISVATTRSIIFSVFALYTTIGKQILSMFPTQYSLIGLGIVIFIVNAYFAKKVQRMRA